MLHLDPNAKGRWIKLGNLGWKRLADIDRGARAIENGKNVVHVFMKRGGAPLVYRGDKVDQVKDALDREAGR